MDQILDTFTRCGKISRGGGGIGLSIDPIRSEGSLIHGTNGISSGILLMLKCLESIANYIDQGGLKRLGAFAVYLSPWHADIFTFIKLRDPHLPEDQTTTNLFIGLWVPDLFMKRVEEDGDWCLFSPDDCPDLVETWGEKFEERYSFYETQPNYIRKKIKARELYFQIIKYQIETGSLYMLYKDQANRCSNQQNLGTIHSSNLCT